MPSLQVRKRIQIPGQIYIEGQYLPSTALEINSRTLQLAISPNHIFALHPEVFTQGQAVGVVLMPTAELGAAVKLVAQIEQVNRTEAASLLELSFPQVLDSRQGQRIKTLLYGLDAAAD